MPFNPPASNTQTGNGSNLYALASGGGSGGVSSLNTLDGALALTSTGGSVAITTVGQNINLEATGAGVSQIISAEGIAVSPAGGTGVVTISSNELAIGSGTVFGPAGTNTATLWEVGNLLFCAVAISPNNPSNPGYAYFSLPNGLKWVNSTASAIWPQVICSAVSPNPPATITTDTYIASAQVSQPTSPVNNNNIVIQCTNAAGAPITNCMVNVIAFGPRG
jgi:hypothetical protein